MKKPIVVLAVLLLVAVPLISACSGDGDGGVLTAEEHFDKGDDYYFEGRLDDAIAEYNKAIRLAPQDAEAYFSRGITYDELGQYERAIDDLDEAIRLDPQFALAYANRAMAYTALDRDQEAERDIEKAVELGLLRPDLLNELIEEIKAQRKPSVPTPSYESSCCTATATCALDRSEMGLLALQSEAGGYPSSISSLVRLIVGPQAMLDPLGIGLAPEKLLFESEPKLLDCVHAVSMKPQPPLPFRYLGVEEYVGL